MKAYASFYHPYAALGDKEGNTFSDGKELMTYVAVRSANETGSKMLQDPHFRQI